MATFHRRVPFNRHVFDPAAVIWVPETNYDELARESGIEALSIVLLRNLGIARVPTARHRVARIELRQHRVDCYLDRIFFANIGRCSLVGQKQVG